MNLNFKKSVSYLSIMLGCITASVYHPEARANWWACQLNRGYDLPENISLTSFCGFNEGLASAINQTTNKFGAVNRQGKVIIPFQYDTQVYFWKSKALVKKDDNWLIIDKNNQELASYDFEDTDGYFTSSGIIKFKMNGKWGLMNADGKIITPPQFDQFLTSFSLPNLERDLYSQVAIFEKNGKKGAVNDQGKIIIPAKFDEIIVEQRVLLVFTDEKMGVYDYQGKQIHPVIFEPEMGFYSDNQWTKKNWLPLVKNNKVGAMNKYGRLVVPIEFDSVELISEDSFRVSKNKKYGIYSDNHLIYPMVFDSIGYLTEGYTTVKYNGEWGYMDGFGSLILVDYDELQSFSEGLAGVGKNTSKNSNNQRNSESKEVPNTDITQSKHRYQADQQGVERHQKWGYINTLGNEVISTSYDVVTPFKHGLASVKLNEKWGVINFQDEIVVPFEYDNISAFKNGYAIVEKHVNQHKEEVLTQNTAYDASQESQNITNQVVTDIDSYTAKQTTKYGLINKQGKLILDVEYDGMTPVSEGVLAIKKGEKWGLANQYGTLMLPYQFDNVLELFEEGSLQVDNCYDSFYDEDWISHHEPKSISCDNDKVVINSMRIDKQGNIISDFWVGKDIGTDADVNAEKEALETK